MEARKDFDKVYLGYDRFMQWFGLYRCDEIISLLSLTGSEKVLDIGGGTGFLARKLTSLCKEVSIVDESEKMLSKCPNHPQISKICADALNLPFADNSFDRVVLSDVLHHIENQTPLMQEIFRVLTPGGMVIIHDFNPKAIKTRLLICFERVLFGALFFRQQSEVEELLNEAGLQVTTTKSQGNYYLIKGAKPC